MLGHQLIEFCAGIVIRSVVNIDNLEAPLPIECLGDFRHKRRDIAGFVANGHHDGDRRIDRRHGAMSYGARSSRATALMRLSEGPGYWRIIPSGSMANPSLRSAK